MYKHSHSSSSSSSGGVSSTNSDLVVMAVAALSNAAHCILSFKYLSNNNDNEKKEIQLIVNLECYHDQVPYNTAQTHGACSAEKYFDYIDML